MHTRKAMNIHTPIIMKACADPEFYEDDEADLKKPQSNGPLTHSDTHQYDKILVCTLLYTCLHTFYYAYVCA